MINKYLHILICLIILLLGMSFVPPVTADSNPPPLPNIFTGTVKINGENAPIGIEVQAYIGSICAGSASVGDAGEYKLRVSGASTDEGKLITFMVGSLTAAETQIYSHETSPRILDLTILDNEGPETTTSAPEGWQTSSFTVTLLATDNAGDSFLNATFFKLDEGPFEIGNSVEINEDGNHSITYYSDDLSGNIEVEKTVYAKLDTAAPVTSDNVPDDWQTSSFTVTLLATDNLGDSFLNATFFKLDEGPFEVGNSVEINEDGNHSITYYSDDLAGNVEAAKTVYAKLDTAAPVTSDNVPDGWQTSSFTVTLLATDNTGNAFLNATFFKLDEGPFEIGNSVEINEDGNHSITYYSDDLAGNVEAAKTVYAKLDTAAPVTSDDVPDGWQTSSFTVTLLATDNTGDSFLNATFFKLDEDPFEIGNSVEINEDGNHSITYYSDDLAGNIEAIKTISAKLDTRPPKTTVDAPEGFQIVPFRVNFTATDESSGSGVNSTFYRFEDDVASVCGNSLYIDKDGSYTIIYYSDDLAGNLEEEKRVQVELDTAAPILKNLTAFPLSILNDSVDASKVTVNVTDMSETGIVNVTIDLSPIEGANDAEMYTSDDMLYTYEICTNKTGEFMFCITATNNVGKSNTDSINITVKTKEAFIADYDGEDGVTQEDIRSVKSKYESGELSGSAAVKVIGKAYNVTYEGALALLGISS